MWRLITSAILTFSLAGCLGINQEPPFTESPNLCKIDRYLIDVELPDTERAAMSSQGIQTYRDVVKSAMSDEGGDMLFLSGGSQDGAFGAGLLDGWRERDDGLPRFRVVTGISTGALQATGAFIGEPEIAVKGYAIDSEDQILETHITGDELDSNPVKVALVTVRKGAFAELIPLYSRLDELLSDRVLHAVASRYEVEQARLLVGATDVDAGKAIAFDLTELAARYAKAVKEAAELSGSEALEGRKLAEARAASAKDCYIRALIASSTVPPGAKPAFIDNRMYIDGGAKFAVFAEDIGEMVEEQIAEMARSTTDEQRPITRIYIVLNSTGEIEQKCSKADEEMLCPGGNDGLALEGRHRDWNVPSLAGRSLKLLINQVERLSVDRAANLAREGEVDVIFVRISEEDRARFETDIEGPFEPGLRSCAEWLALDDELINPVEFHPRFMRCMIEYGRALGRQDNWARLED